MKNERGYTLILVLMIIVVFTLLTTVLVGLVLNHSKLTNGERDDVSVYYIAEAGIASETQKIEDEIRELYRDQASKKNPDIFFNKLDNIILGLSTLNNFVPSFGEEPRAEINVVKEKVIDKNKRKYVIVSKGLIGRKNRAVEQTLSIEWIPPKDEDDKPTLPIESFPENTTIFVKNDVFLNGKVEGNIVTSKKSANSILASWSQNFRGEIYVPPGFENSAVGKENNMTFNPVVKAIGKSYDFKLPIFQSPSPPLLKDVPSNYTGNGKSTLSLKNNSSLDKLRVEGSHKLTIDIGNNDIDLVLNEINISGAGEIIIKGTGKLNLYVNNKFEITGSAKLNAVSPISNLNIFYSGSNISLNGDTRIYGSIIADKADILIAGSNAIFGSVITGGKSFIVIGGGTVQPSLYYAPNAHFEVIRSGKIYGTIIGNSIEVSGGGEVHYRRFSGEWPFDTEPGNPDENPIEDLGIEKGTVIER